MPGVSRMSKSRGVKPPQGDPLIGVGLSFEEALERFIRADPNELSIAIENNRKHADEISRSARQRRQRLRDAEREPTKKFGI